MHIICGLIWCFPTHSQTRAFICAYTNIYMHTQIDASGQLRFQYLVQGYFDT